jgi:transcriptional regulator with XRE-family HTH domain
VEDPTDPIPAWMLEDPRTARTAEFLAGIHRATGARIKRSREATGLSRAQLAEALVERGHPEWTAELVERLEIGRRVWKPIEQDLVKLIGFSPNADRAEVSFDGAIGANVRSVRVEAGITQTDLAARLTSIGTPWTASNVSLIEAGKRKLTLTALADLCRVFNVEAAAFFGTEGFGPAVAERNDFRCHTARRRRRRCR